MAPPAPLIYAKQDLKATGEWKITCKRHTNVISTKSTLTLNPVPPCTSQAMSIETLQAHKTAKALI